MGLVGGDKVDIIMDYMVGLVGGVYGWVGLVGGD